MEAARQAGVKKFVAIGTICAYPKFTKVPFSESKLWDGYPEETNAPYGLAKKCFWFKLGHTGNNTDLTPFIFYQSTYTAQETILTPRVLMLYRPSSKKWLMPKRWVKILLKCGVRAKLLGEFLYVEDAARAIVLAAEKYDKPNPINLGAGREITIKKLVEIICSCMKFKGEIRWDKTKPDGQPRRKLDVTRAKKEFGFVAKTSFETGLKKPLIGI